jgi:aspartyl/glutamyl-tRNA(Asn/Gln) amidotransferase C subunit
VEDVRRLAGLSRLNLTSVEEEELKAELSSILGYFRAVDSVPGSGPPAKDRVVPADLRSDEVKPSQAEGVLRGVPRKKGRLVRAPRVF